MEIDIRQKLQEASTWDLIYKVSLVALALNVLLYLSTFLGLSVPYNSPLLQILGIPFFLGIFGSILISLNILRLQPKPQIGFGYIWKNTGRWQRVILAFTIIHFFIAAFATMATSTYIRLPVQHQGQLIQNGDTCHIERQGTLVYQPTPLECKLANTEYVRLFAIVYLPFYATLVAWTYVSRKVRPHPVAG